MTDTDKDSNSEGNVEGVINAVTGLAKAIPIYEDAVQPAAQEIGKALGTVAKTVNVALAPVSALVWSYDHIKEFVDTTVSEKLKDVPEENIVTPPPNVAGPLLESLRYSGTIDELKELYANLLASAMDSDTKNNAHPSFVEIIKQLSANEAKLLSGLINVNAIPVITIRNNFKGTSKGIDYYRNFTDLGELTGVTNVMEIPQCLDNLCRLGITNIPFGSKLTEEGIYEQLEQHISVTDALNTINNIEGREGKIKRKALFVTDLGRQFIDTCVKDH